MLQTSVSACVYIFNANYCASMLTPANRASLGEPLQTLSELVGASLSEPLSCESAACPPTLPVWIYIFVCFLYLGQQFGQRFRRLARSCDSFEDGNSFRDVRDDRRKTRMPFSRRSRRIFKHADGSFFGTPCHFDRLPVLVLARLIPFEPFDKHKKHSSRTRKTREHSGHLLKGRERRGTRVLLRRVGRYILRVETSISPCFDHSKTVTWFVRQHIHAFEPFLSE